MIAIEGIPARAPAAVLAFPAAGGRRARPAIGPGEPRGEILLFTGVRYERAADDQGPVERGEPSRPVPPAGSAPRRRRRS